jgi:RHS repeat-associated protein
LCLSYSGFTISGSHTFTIVDRGNGTRQTTTNMVSVTTPPDPTPIQFESSPAPFEVPESVTPPPAIPYGWAAPIQGRDWLFGTQWKGYPKGIVPAGPGSRYVFSAVALKNPIAWWAGTFYTCAYLGWENPPTAERANAYGTGYLPYQDPAFTADGMDDQNSATTNAACGTWDGPFSEALFGTLGPVLSDPAGLTAQAAHINVQNGSGNADGFFQLNATPPEDTGCDGNNGQEAKRVADPINSRDGSFSYTEHDLGVATGCTSVGLKFERFYNQYHTTSTIFSPGWTHTFDQRILTYGSDVLVQRPGGYTQFKDVGGTVYAGVPGSRQVLLKRPGGGWVLLHRDRRADLFDSQGRLEAQQDPNGNMIWMTYENYSREDLSGTRLARVDAPGGRYLWFGYDYYQPGQMIVVGDNAGRTVRFSYDDLGRLIAVKDALNHTSTYTYEGNHWLLKSKTDANGHPVFTNGFDESGRVITQTNNLGQSVDLSYAVISDTNGLMGTTNSAGTGVPYPALLLTTVMTDQTGLVTTFVYGSDGLLRKVSDSTGATTRYRNYTETRKPGEIETSPGQVTSYVYNALGLSTRVTNALGDSTFTTYNTWGQATLITDTLGHQIDMTYVGPNLVAIAGNGGRSFQIDYQDQAGWKQMVSSITQSGALTTTLTYDVKGDITAITDADGRSLIVHYDAVGRPIQLVDPVGFTTTLEYDAQDNVLKLTEWTGDEQATPRTSSFAYDAVGNVLTTTNPLDQVTSYRYDPLNRLVEQTLADTSVIGFRYDDHTATFGLTPPDQPEHTLSANSLLAQYAPPAIGGAQVSTSYTYNLLNQLVGIERPDGLDLSVQYDLLGRTTAITQPNGVLSVTYDRRSTLPKTLTAPDGGILEIGYDANAMPITSTWTGAVVGSLYQTFNLQGQVIQQAINSQQPVAFTYDQAGTLRQAGALNLGYQSATGLLTGTSLAATSDAWTYNAFGEPTAYQAEYDQEAVLALGFDYNAIGAIVTRTETLDGMTNVYHYEYDDIGQLTAVSKNGTILAGYTYDDNGNRLTTTMGQGIVSASYDDQDRLLTWGTTSYTYTLNGELATKTTPNGTTQYVYDVMGNLESVTLPDLTVITYIYDALNRRIGKKINGTLVQGWLYADGLLPIAELDGSGAVVSQFVYGSRVNSPDYFIRGGQTYRIVADQVGSPRLVINTATGQVVQRLVYDTWGVVTSDSNPGFQPFGFAGGLYDPSTNLVRFGARDYEAITGRWTAKDPIGFNGGDTNLYRYVGNNPVNLVDPAGTMSQIGKALIRRSVMMGAIGGLMAMAGSMLGQYLTNGRCWNLINWKSVRIAGLTGAASGALLPLAGTSLVGAAAIGSGSSAAQYGLTQYVNNEPTSRGGWFLSIGIGGLTGIAAGAYDASGLSSANGRLLPFWREASDPRYDRLVADSIMHQMHYGNLTAGNLARAAGAGVASNADYLNFKTDCKCSK